MAVGVFDTISRGIKAPLLPAIVDIRTGGRPRDRQGTMCWSSGDDMSSTLTIPPRGDDGRPEHFGTVRRIRLHSPAAADWWCRRHCSHDNIQPGVSRRPPPL